MGKIMNKTKKILRNKRRQRGGNEEPPIVNTKEETIQILEENKIIEKKIAEIETKIKENDDKKYYDKKYYKEFKESFELLKSKYKNNAKNDDNLIIELNNILENISKEIYSCENIKNKDAINKSKKLKDNSLDELLAKCAIQDEQNKEEIKDEDDKINNFNPIPPSSKLNVDEIPAQGGKKRTKRTRGKKAGKRSKKTAKKMRS